MAWWPVQVSLASKYVGTLAARIPRRPWRALGIILPRAIPAPYVNISLNLSGIFIFPIEIIFVALYVMLESIRQFTSHNIEARDVIFQEEATKFGR